MKKNTRKVVLGFTVFALALGIAAVPAMSLAATSIVNRSQGLGDLFILDALFNNASDNQVLSGSSGATLGDLFILDKLFPVTTAAAPTVSLGQQLAGRIVIQVESHGEAWYVRPSDFKRVSLGDPTAAFNYMKSVAVGISNADFNSYNGTAPSRLSGKFLLKTEDNGKLYYVNPVDHKMIYVNGASGAAALIQSVGLGITNANLNKITVAT